jgi:hypothetical protein
MLLFIFTTIVITFLTVFILTHPVNYNIVLYIYFQWPITSSITLTYVTYLT